VVPSIAYAEDRVRVTYQLPPGVKSFKYEPNTHFVELTDGVGEILHLPAKGVMAHQCRGCQFIWWTTSNLCSFCPSCMSTDVGRIWGKLQIAFVPETESKFTPPTPALLSKSAEVEVSQKSEEKTLVPTGDLTE
jgi:hypothetical protein